MTGWEELEQIAHRVAAEYGLGVLPADMKSVYEGFNPRAKTTDARRIALYLPGTQHAFWHGYDADEVRMLDELPLTDETRELAEMLISNLARRLMRYVSK